MQASGYLIMVNVPPEEWSGAIVCMEQTIGRDREASIVIPDRFRIVSRLHAAIWADAKDQIFIRDLGSRFGTDVNGIQLKPDEQYGLVTGDRVTLGRLELQVTDSLPPLPELIAELNVPDLHETWDMTNMDRGPGEEAREFLSLVSNAELEVMLWLCRGYTQLAAVGKKLHRSPHTVRTQLNSIYRKLNVHSRDELIGKLRRASRETGSGAKQRVAQ